MPTDRPTRVLVVGDVMLDEYVLGHSDRLSPESPVPVVRVAEERAGLGGAANVARQVTALGGHATLVGVVGNDARAAEVRRCCAEAGIVTALVVDGDRPTTAKQRVLIGRQQVVRVDREETGPIDGDVERELVATIAAQWDDPLGPVDVVIVSDYAKGALTPAVLRATIDDARAAGARVLVDPKHHDLSRYRGAHVVKANQAEFEAALGAGPLADPVRSVAKAGAALVRDVGIDDLVVTLGGGGMVVLAAGADPVAIPTSVREVYDVSGAGDTVIATLGLQLAAGLPLAEAAVIANVAAGLAVQRAGVATVGADELEAAVQASAGPGGAASAVVARGELTRRVGRWRDEGRRIVFTNGCFDLFHAGHVHLLAEASRLGGALIVAVDRDRSVRKLKGEGRPIIGEADRMAIISALGCVDAVVPFDSDELLDLIALVGPDVLVKGADYSEDRVVGAELVRRHGGEVAFIEHARDVSTSALVERIREA